MFRQKRWLNAYDANGVLLTSATKTFTGVTNKVYTPTAITVSASEAKIAKVTFYATQHVYGGIYIEKITSSISCPSAQLNSSYAVATPVFLSSNLLSLIQSLSRVLRTLEQVLK